MSPATPTPPARSDTEIPSAAAPRHASRPVTRTIRLGPRPVPDVTDAMAQPAPAPVMPQPASAQPAPAPSAPLADAPQATPTAASQQTASELRREAPVEASPPRDSVPQDRAPMTVDADGVVYPEPPPDEPMGSPLTEPPPLLRPSDAPPRVHADAPPERPMPPTPPEPDCFLMAMFYLAEQMAQADGVRAISEQQTIDGFAGLAGVPEFRRHPWYRALNEDLACAMLRGELLQKTTLVLLSLVLKADGERLRVEHRYFTRIRLRLGAAPITVPINLDRHRYLALKYLRATMGLD